MKAVPLQSGAREPRLGGAANRETHRTGRTRGTAPGWRSLDTPALLVDLDRVEDNIRSMAREARQSGLDLRPHFKTHKSLRILRMQIDAGASGVTVSKLDEAEVIVDAGLDTPVFVAYEIVAAPKLARAMRLASRARMTLAVDGIEGGRMLSGAATEAGLRVDVWLEIDSGLQRTGVTPEEAPALARALATLPGIHVTGVFTHGGHAYAASSPARVAEIGELEAAAVVRTAREIRELGVPIRTVSAGSTPTARHLMGMPGLTEIRPGTYVFMDGLQVALGTATLDACALTVAATVVSRPAAARAVVDAGSKTLGLDRGGHSATLIDHFGRVVLGVSRLRPADASLARLSEEHGVLQVRPASRIGVGDRVRILPNHACTVANLGRSYAGLRGGRVVEEFPIEAAAGTH